MIKIKLVTNKLKQIKNLVALVEGSVVIGLQNLLCDEDILPQFHKEKNKLARLFVGLETDITRYISQQQILALVEIVKIGHKLIPLLYQKKLVGAAYLNDFLNLAEGCPK